MGVPTLLASSFLGAGSLVMEVTTPDDRHQVIRLKRKVGTGLNLTAPTPRNQKPQSRPHPRTTGRSPRYVPGGDISD